MSELDVPPEPVELRNSILGLINVFGGEGGVSSALWVGNRLASYLWRFWRVRLSGYGITWQEFLRVLKGEGDYALKWVMGRVTWREFIDRLRGDLNTLIRGRGVGLLKWVEG